MSFTSYNIITREPFDCVTIQLNQIFNDHNHSSYVTDMFSMFGEKGVWVGSNTLRPDKSYSSKHLTWFIEDQRKLFEGKVVLDMGCGCGVQTLALCYTGAQKVDSVDISQFAVASTKINCIRHGFMDKVTIYHSDLFAYSNIADYDVIVFNHPFFNIAPIHDFLFSFSIMDSGETLCKFFSEIPKRLRPNGLLIMPFSYICGIENDPGLYYRSANIKIIDQNTIIDQNGKHVIYVFMANSEI